MARSDKRQARPQFIQPDKQRALERNRTVDLILTMDVLCQLSYKGMRSVGTLAIRAFFVKGGLGESRLPLTLLSPK